MRHLESAEQITFFEWARMLQNQYPELSLLHAIPNAGKRNVIQGARMKKEGMLAGVSDIFLPVARCGYHGLYIEMKVKGNTTSASQKWFIGGVTEQGYLATVCFGWVEAKEVLEGYLKDDTRKDLG